MEWLKSHNLNSVTLFHLWKHFFYSPKRGSQNAENDALLLVFELKREVKRKKKERERDPLNFHQQDIDWVPAGYVMSGTTCRFTLKGVTFMHGSWGKLRVRVMALTEFIYLFIYFDKLSCRVGKFLCTAA